MFLETGPGYLPLKKRQKKNIFIIVEALAYISVRQDNGTCGLPVVTFQYTWFSLLASIHPRGVQGAKPMAK